MALRSAKGKSKKQTDNPKQSNKKANSQQDDVMAFLEKQKKDAEALEAAGQCMFC